MHVTIWHEAVLSSKVKNRLLRAGMDGVSQTLNCNVCSNICQGPSNFFGVLPMKCESIASARSRLNAAMR
eukprot:6175682-Pleurochrysis_carterae.AAC.5